MSPSVRERNRIAMMQKRLSSVRWLGSGLDKLTDSQLEWRLLRVRGVPLNLVDCKEFLDEIKTACWESERAIEDEQRKRCKS
jgi:hypothetical protein